jgi:hypothetical protein
MDVLARYIGTYSVNLIKEGKYLEAVDAFNKYGVVTIPQYFDIYTRLAREIIHRGNPEAMSSLRELLFKLSTTTGAQQQFPAKFKDYLFIAHLFTLKHYCSRKKDLVYFGAKQAISLLRYTKDIQPDAAFYEAGRAAKVRFALLDVSPVISLTDHMLQ